MILFVLCLPEYDEEKIGISYEEYFEEFIEIFGYTVTDYGVELKRNEDVRLRHPKENITETIQELEKYRAQLEVRMPRTKARFNPEEPELPDDVYANADLQLLLELVLEEYEEDSSALVIEEDDDDEEGWYELAKAEILLLRNRNSSIKKELGFFETSALEPIDSIMNFRQNNRSIVTLSPGLSSTSSHQKIDEKYQPFMDRLFNTRRSFRKNRQRYNPEKIH